MDLFNLVLEQKEKRYKERLAYENEFKSPVICFSLNIPYLYKVKNIDEVKALFLYGINELIKNLNPINYKVYLDDLFCLFAISDDAYILKEHCIRLENKHSFSRLFDFDVYFKNEVIKARASGRKCFLCDELAIVCQRNNTHTKDEIYQKIDDLFDDFYVYKALNYPYKNEFSSKALRALLYEVSLAPKLGLVEIPNSNSHSDMNFLSFIDSASELKWYFDSFYTLAMLSKRNEFKRLKRLGQLAENAMFKATNNINTHKGALFLFAIMIYVCAKNENDLNPINISKTTKQICENLCKNELNKNLNSIGGKCFHLYGIKGIRDEVEQGFLNTFKAYEFFNKQSDFKELRTLFYISSIIDDTSLLKRCEYDLQKYKRVKNTCKKLSTKKSKNYINLIKKLNYIYVKNNLSFGGSADVLSLVFFLDFIYKINSK